MALKRPTLARTRTYTLTHTHTPTHKHSYTHTRRFRALKGLSLRETVSQFSHTMTAQADLRVEAAHIARFARDFAPVWAQVCVLCKLACVCVCAQVCAVCVFTRGQLPTSHVCTKEIFPCGRRYACMCMCVCACVYVCSC
jgi:hypothetical protein